MASLLWTQYEKAEKLTVFTSWRKFDSQFSESWPVLLMISHTAAAVAGTMHLWSKQSFPMFTMWNPSTSFSGATALHMALSLMCSDRDTFKKFLTIANMNQINLACCVFIIPKEITVALSPLFVSLNTVKILFIYSKDPIHIHNTAFHSKAKSSNNYRNTIYHLQLYIIPGRGSWTSNPLMFLSLLNLSINSNISSWDTDDGLKIVLLDMPFKQVPFEKDIS